MEEEATTTEEIVEIVEEIPNPDVLLDGFMMSGGASYTSTSGNYPDINAVLDNYFQILPTSYFLMIVAFGIISIWVYTLYSYLEK